MSDPEELANELRRLAQKWGAGEGRQDGRLAIADRAADYITAQEAEIAGLRDALHKDSERRTQQLYADQKRAAARFGFEPGMLQWAWRNGERTDKAELEWAIVDALAMGGVYSWPGDGVGCAAQIVVRQMARAEAAEAELAAIRARASTEKETR